MRSTHPTYLKNTTNYQGDWYFLYDGRGDPALEERSQDLRSQGTLPTKLHPVREKIVVSF